MTVSVLARQGITLRLDGDRLIARPAAGSLTSDQRTFIRDHKTELIEELDRRIPLDMEASWREAIHPVDAVGQAIQKIHWVLGECPEIGYLPSEVAAYYGTDLVEISKLDLEQVYRLLADLWKTDGITAGR